MDLQNIRPRIRLPLQLLIICLTITLMVLAPWNISIPQNSFSERTMGHAVKPGLVHVKGPVRELPLSFVPNRGQTDSAVKFIAGGLGDNIFFTSNEVVLSRASNLTQPDLANGAQGQAIRMRFEGADPTLQVTPYGPQPGRISYMIGDDPEKWITGLPTFTGVIYEGLYPGIDLQYKGRAGTLKGTFLVAPGADPTQIKWRYDGFTQLAVNDQGDLIIGLHNAAGDGKNSSNDLTISESAPIAWQEIAGQSVPVSIRYLPQKNGIISFSVGHYDPAHLLTIDPTLEFSSLLGGSDTEFGTGITLDGDGNIYLAGITASTDFPTVNPAQPSYGGGTCPGFPCSDAFAAKLSPDGSTLLYSTYLGGSENDEGLDISIDSQGNVYLTGSTSSQDFPTFNPLQNQNGGAGTQDVFISKLNPSGDTLIFSSYLGGTENDVGAGITHEAGDQTIITGWTYSADFPLLDPLQPSLEGSSDAFVTRITANGNALVYSTYLGGEGRDWAQDVAIDNNQDVYLTGGTLSTDFPSSRAPQGVRGNGLADAYVAVLKNDGSELIISMIVGGAGMEEGTGIALDDDRNIYVTGHTTSEDFPTESALQSTFGGLQDAFLFKLQGDGSALIYSTYLGGSHLETGGKVFVDEDQSVYVVGSTSSADFPAINPLQYYQGGICQGDPCADIFVAKVKSDGSKLLFSTFLGGTSRDAGFDIAADSTSNLYLTGATWSTDFPTANTLGGGSQNNVNAFVTKIGLAPTTPDVDTYIRAPSLSGGLPNEIAVLPIQVGNQGATLADSVTLTMTLHSNLTYVGDTSNITPTIAGDVVTWQLADLVFLESDSFNIYVDLPDEPALGTRYPTTLYINSAGVEANPTDNTTSTEIMVARQLYLPAVFK
jgi:hypothetical protein